MKSRPPRRLDDCFRTFLTLLIPRINSKRLNLPSSAQYVGGGPVLTRSVRFSNLLTQTEWEIEKRKRKNRIRERLPNVELPGAESKKGVVTRIHKRKVPPPPLFGVKGDYYDWLNATLGNLDKLSKLFHYCWNKDLQPKTHQLEGCLADPFFLWFEAEKQEILVLVAEAWIQAVDILRVEQAGGAVSESVDQQGSRMPSLIDTRPTPGESASEWKSKKASGIEDVRNLVIKDHYGKAPSGKKAEIVAQKLDEIRGIENDRALQSWLHQRYTEALHDPNTKRKVKSLFSTTYRRLVDKLTPPGHI